MTQRNPTLTVAIPAFNEEGGIIRGLNPIALQRHSNFTLSRVVVYSDGSTDGTNSTVRKFIKLHPQVSLVEGKKRLGKIARLNQIFNHNSSDILVTVDADISIIGDTFLSDLCQVISTDPTAMVVAAHQIPLKTTTFIGRIFHADYELWDQIRLRVPAQNHVHNLYGAGTAYRGSFAASLHIPNGLGEERSYIFLMVKRVSGFRYSFAAKLLYWPANTIEDYYARASRAFGKNVNHLEAQFGPEAVNLNLIPRPYRLRGLVTQLVKNPLFTSLAVALNVYMRFFPIMRPINTTGLLERLPSTKRSFPI